MARLCKKGLVYFPLDVEFFNDRKIRKLNIRTNFTGATVYLFILTLIYKNSYYIETTVEDLAEDIASFLADKDTYSIDKVEKIIDLCINIGLFDKDLVEQGIFTSKGIQKQYLLSTRRRKGVNISLYNLLNTMDMTAINIKIHDCEQYDTNNENENDYCNQDEYNNEINVDNNSVEANRGSHNAYQSTQSKSKRKSNKERETKSSKDKRDKNDKNDKTNLYGLPKIHYLTQKLINDKFIDEFCLDIPKFNNLFEEICETYSFENVCIATNYLLKYSRTAEPPIDYPYAFFSSSILRALSHYQEELKHSNETFEEWVLRISGGILDERI